MEKLGYFLLDPAKTIIVRFFNSSEENFNHEWTHPSESTHQIWIDAVQKAKDHQKLGDLDLFQVIFEKSYQIIIVLRTLLGIIIVVQFN